MDNLLTIMSMVTQSGSDLHDSLAWICETAESKLKPNHFFTNESIGQQLKDGVVHLFDLFDKVCYRSYEIVKTFGVGFIDNMSLSAMKEGRNLAQEVSKIVPHIDNIPMPQDGKDFIMFIANQLDYKTEYEAGKMGWINFADLTLSNVIDNKNVLKSIIDGVSPIGK